MKRVLVSTLLFVTCIVFVVDASLAKKKPGKHVQEEYEATLGPPILGASNVSFGIEEYTTDEEMQGLAQTFAQRGAEGVETALRKGRKGYFQLANYESSDIVLAMVTSTNGVRRLGIVGIAPNRFIAAGPAQNQTSFGYFEFPWTFIQIEVDEKGNGKGSLIPLAKVVFNEQGKMVVKPLAASNIPRLANVHSIK